MPRETLSALGKPGYQTQIDSMTGETILPDEGNELLGGGGGVIWSCKHVTLTRCADRNVDPGMAFLLNFSQLVTLCPEGCILTFKTHSSESVEQCDRMIQWRECG
jgi:hypothetical protein